MSSLCAVATFDGTDVDVDTIARMATAAPHLDDADVTGSWLGAGAALATASPPAHHSRTRPVTHGDLVCVADARLDNRRQLRALLGDVEAAGKESDASLIGRAYGRWGVRCTDHLLGDYAFVVWDTGRRQLFAARDAMGARTLYYRAEAHRILVATEAKQILADPDVPREPNERSLIADIAGLYALPSMSPFAGIDQLAPGHVLTADMGGARIMRHWDVDPHASIRFRDTADYAERLRELLTSAVADRLESAGRIGMFLSGGLDAISVASTAARALCDTRGSVADLHASSWAFSELPGDDERRVSEVVSDAHDFSVTAVPADDAWPLKDYPEHGPDLDDPFIWLYQPLIDRTLACAHRDGVQLMMTTDRGDEMVGNWVHDDLGLLLAGRLGALRTEHRAQGSPPLLGYVRSTLARPLVDKMWPPDLRPTLRNRLVDRGRPRRRRPPPWVPTDAARRVDLVGVMDAFTPTWDMRDPARRERYASVFHPDSLRVAQLRRRSFVHQGVEYADPWGDRRIAAYVCAIPQWQVQRHSRPKMLTQEAMRGIVPEPVRRRPSRSSPVGLFRRAFNERETATVHRLLDDSRAAAAGWLDAKAVRASFESYLRGEDQAHDFWHPLCVEMWLRKWWD